MKILLLGEYSNLHATLAEGLRELGHKVTVVSDGNAWRNYKRDITLKRGSTSKLSGIFYLLKVLLLLPKLRGYDVVQLINPDFIWLKGERQYYVYQYLRRHNKRIFIGAFGCDWYWVDAGLHKRLLRYGDFYIGDKMRTDEPQNKKFIDEWIDTPKGDYCRKVMTDCDGIPACLYEYQVCYSSYFPEKTRFIPLPIQLPKEANTERTQPSKVVVFFGIDVARMAYKGTDIMLRAAEDIRDKYKESMELVIARSVPFDEYQRMMEGCDAIIDQLYSYTPSMNSLLAMSKGIICIGGGEPENYEIIDEHELRPIINVEPTYESVYHELEQLVLHPERIPALKQQSIEYVRRHHDYRKVAGQYFDFWNSI